MARGERGVRLVPGGLDVGGQRVPLYAGSVHYWRLDPRDWRACLEATKALGARLVDLYIPWGVHETGPGQFDFGRTDARRDVASFLRIAHEVGLYAIARPRASYQRGAHVFRDPRSESSGIRAARPGRARVTP
jgi:beta-galactosidase